MTDAEIEAKIDEFFRSNYDRMLAEGGIHILTPRALAQARQQVEHYWKKMREIAVSVTDTEVRLQLPNRTTPKGRDFVIEGVVDLVREADQIRMYDIKTHYCGEVETKRDSYAAQLNVYAYIWRELRGQAVHELGVIAVQLPEGLRLALRDGRNEDVERELAGWNPLVPIPFSASSIEGTIRQISETVDRIEDGEFAPPSVEHLRAPGGHERGRPVAFATLHCRNCDGRFSCDSYRAYVSSGSSRHSGRFDMRRYLTEAEEAGELDEWIDGNLPDDV